MLNSNYPNFLKTIIIRNRGFWRIEAIGRLSKRINKGETQLEYLKNLITLHEKQNNKSHSFFHVTSIKSPNRNIKQDDHLRSMSSQTFFVTQVPSRNKRRKINYYKNEIFMNEDEEHMYNQIELHPFEIKYMRNRDENQKYFNVLAIKKEIESNYNYIRNEQLKNRPFTSYYKRKLNKNLFGYESKTNSANISINKYYSNNMSMSKKRKEGYNVSNLPNSDSNSENQSWKTLQDRKRIISAYLNDKSRGNLFAEDNELFEKIKKSRKVLSSKNRNKVKSINNSTMTDDLMDNTYSNILLQKKNNSEFDKNTIKEVLNERIFNSLNNEDKFKINKFLRNKINKNSGLKNSGKINNYFGGKNGKNIYKKSYFNYNSFQNNEKGFKYIRNKNENEKIDLNNDFIDKKSTIIKVK